MINLILSVISSSGNSLIMKLAERKTSNKSSLLLINYVVAVFFGGILMLQDSAAISISQLGQVPALAAINGIFYVSTFLLLQLNIHKNGATVSASLSHMGLMIPVLMSIFLFSEYPNSAQTAGVLVAAASLIVISIPSHVTGKTKSSKTPECSCGKAEADNKAKAISSAAAEISTSTESAGSSAASSSRYRWLLIPMLLSGGMADTMSKVFEAFCDHALEDIFLSLTFLAALIICALVCLLRREKMNRFDVIYGLVLGLSNYLSTKFLIRAIYVIPAYMAYISYGLGVVIFVNLINLLFMHESLSRRDYIGMALAMSAIVLLNLS